MIDADVLLAAIDDHRGSMREKLPEGVWQERDGPLVRTVGQAHGGFIQYSDLAGLEGADLDALIQRQVRYFAERGEPFEWKLYGHDRPAICPIASVLPASCPIPWRRSWSRPWWQSHTRPRRQRAS